MSSNGSTYFSSLSSDGLCLELTSIAPQRPYFTTHMDISEDSFDTFLFSLKASKFTEVSKIVFVHCYFPLKPLQSGLPPMTSGDLIRLLPRQ